jgi:hypothetical protein
MEKVILTRGRWEQAFTVKHIPKEILKDIVLCCHKGEAEHYNKLYPDAFKEVKEYEGENVAEARHWVIMDSKDSSVLFLEDNIELIIRGEETQLGNPNKNKLYKITPKHFDEPTRVEYISRIFNDIETKITNPEYSLFGLSARGGNNHVEADYQDNCRMYGCWAIDVAAYKGIPQKLTDVVFREDFYIILSFLKNAQKVGCFYKYAMEKVKGIGTDGGCSNYRTQELTDENAKWMSVEFHPFVTAVSKEREWIGYSGLVWDVRVQWKKMYEYYREQLIGADLFS